MKDSNLKAIGKIDFIPRKFSKKELCKLFDFLTLRKINEKAFEAYLEFQYNIV